ncbi:MAG TPA: ABC transporter permease [Solirubrobacterales bacterium]|nr:ABC transporter permease [Solirubrobacterales bacterium]
MRLSRGSTIMLRVAVGLGLAFIYIPLIVLAVYAFNSSKILEWPPPGLTFEWFPKAIESTAKDAFWTSIKVGLVATAIALVLGTLASLAVARHRFFGRETISFLVVLPIALPGIVTGVALNNTFTQVLGIDLSLFTVIVAHATFCIVVVYNNSIARLRRMSSSFEEASADLGANTWQTFRFVTLPNMRSALGAGGLLAFGLSFDEIIVTTFTIGAGEQTLPYWIYSNLFRAQQRPIVNAVAVIVVLISIVPVYLAYRLTREEGGLAAARGGGGKRVEGGGVETEATAVP